MASKLILWLVFSLLFVFQMQVSSEPMKNEETSLASQALHMFTRGGDRKLMHNLALDLSRYFKDSVQAVAPAPSPSQVLDCDGLCNHRCSLHSRQNLCVRACGTCCVRCKCVPPGTFGNREMCGKCYTDMTTHANKTKCP